MRACWLKWVGRDWSISADYIWLNYSGANKGKGNRAKGLFAMPYRQHRDGMSISSLLALNTMYRVHFLMPY